MGVNGDHAHGAFGLERPEPFADPRALQPVAGGPRHLGGDEIAILRIRGCARGDGELLSELFLLDRGKPAAAARKAAKNSQHPVLGTIDDLDDTALMANGVLDLLGSEQCPVADSRDLSRPAAARNMDANFRRRTMGFLVPFRRDCDQLAIAVACDDVGENHGRQFAGTMQLLALALEVTLLGELAEHVLEVDVVVTGDAEGAGDLPLADLAGTSLDEGQKFRFAGKAAGFRFLAELFGQWIRRIEPAPRLDGQSAAFRRRMVLLRCAAGAAGAAGVPPTDRDLPGPRAFCAPAFRDRRIGRLEGALPALASIRATASSSCTVSGVWSDGSVALTPLWLT